MRVPTADTGTNSLLTGVLANVPLTPVTVPPESTGSGRLA